MIAPVMFCVLKSCMLSVARTSQEVTHPNTTLAQKREVQHKDFPRGSDGIRCISAGIIAAVMFCVVKTYMLSVAR